MRPASRGSTIAPITDASRKARLDERLIEALGRPSGEVLYLAAPDVVVWAGLVFRYHGERATEEGHADLDLEAYLDRVDVDELTPNSLRNNRIRGMLPAIRTTPRVAGLPLHRL